jgi:hypothetical protein
LKENPEEEVKKPAGEAAMKRKKEALLRSHEDQHKEKAVEVKTGRS